MTWYYAIGNERQGPVDDAELDRLIASRTITHETLVWRAGMADWQPLAQARPQAARPAPPPAPIPVPVPVPAPTPAPIVPSPTPSHTDPTTQPKFGSAPSFGTPGFGAPGTGGGAGAGGYGELPPGSGTGETADEIYARVVGSGRSLAIGEVLSRAWALVSGNLGLAVGATVVVMLCMVVAGIIPCLGVILSLVVNPVLHGGLYRLFLKMHRGEPAEFGDAFSTFSTSFLPLFLFGLVQAVLTVICMLPGYAMIFIGTAMAERNEAMTVVFALLGLLLILPPAIYLGVSWIFSSLLIVDKGLDFWPAMELSRKVAGKHFFSVFGLMFLCGLIILVGVLALCLGIFVAAPIAFAAIAIAYDDLFGRA